MQSRACQGQHNDQWRYEIKFDPIIIFWEMTTVAR
jgi:hypothetical protein